MGFQTSKDTSREARTARIAKLGYSYGDQEKSPLISCNLCDSDLWTIVAHHDRYGFPIQATTCNNCGLTVLNPRMTRSAYGHFYNEIYRPLVSAYHGRKIDAHTIQEEQRMYAREMEKFLGPFLEQRLGMTLLDIGGSTGIVAAHFARRFGLQATVIDPAPAEIAEAKSLGIETIAGFIEAWAPEQRRFDVIGMFQTIDHLLDVKGTLSKIRSIIADDGLFVVDIVDFRAAYLRNWSIEEALKIDHPFSLTESTVETFLLRAGFRPVRKVYSSDKLHIAYVCQPCAPDTSLLPCQDYICSMFRELRFVQNSAASLKVLA